MRIGDLSRLTGVSVRSLRHYEACGLLRSERQANGYREFTADAVARTRQIQQLLSLGLNLEEAALLLPCYAAPEGQPPLCEQAADAYAAKLAEVDRKLAALTDLRERIILHMKRGRSS